jgi:hypothetical protein
LAFIVLKRLQPVYVGDSRNQRTTNRVIHGNADARAIVGGDAQESQFDNRAEDNLSASKPSVSLRVLGMRLDDAGDQQLNAQPGPALACKR